MNIIEHNYNTRLQQQKMNTVTNNKIIGIQRAVKVYNIKTRSLVRDDSNNTSNVNDISSSQVQSNQSKQTKKSSKSTC
mgnify:CR=1 FL=1